MDSKSHSLLLIFISLSSLFLIFSSSSSFVEATCKPTYLTYPIPSSSSSSSSSESDHISTSSSPSSTPPPPSKQVSTPSSSSPSPPSPSTSPPPPPTSSPPPPPPPPTPTSSPPPPPTPTPSTPSTTQAAESISLFSETPITSSPSPKTIHPSIPSVIPSVAGGINAAIKNICAKTDHVDICLSSIAPFLVPGKTDPVSVFGMQLQAVTAHTQTALTTATQMFLNPSNPKFVKSCIEDCKDVYVDAMDSLKSATDALTRRDFPTVDSMLSAAISDFETCEDGFADFEHESPMAAADQLLQKMTSNLLALSSVCKSLP